MVSKKELADEMGITPDALAYNAGRETVFGQVPGNVDGNTALTASTTYYVHLGIVQKQCALESVTIRSEAAGVATCTIDILKVPSGTAVASGTAVVTQLAGNGLTAATNYAMAVVATTAKQFNTGDSLVAKIVSGASETLKPLNVTAVFK